MKEKTKIAKTFKKDILFAAALMIIIGVLFVIFPDKSTIMICYVAGAALCVWGVVAMIMFFMTDRYLAFSSYGLVKGIALLAVGIVILVNPDSLANIIMLVFGIAMIVDGALKLQYAIDLARISSRGWIAVLAVSILMIVLGAVVVIDPFDSAALLMMFAGITMIADGVSDIAAVIYISREFKRAKKEIVEIEIQ